jgi:hypothetical protein
MTFLTAGDHIVTNIDVLGLTEHHGLYIGNDEVIHLTESEARVVKTSLYFFSDGDDVRFKCSPNNPDEAIKKAKNSIGDGGYNILYNNCEQFVNYCISGKRTSNQVSNYGHVGSHVAARYGSLGTGLSRVATGPVAIVTVASSAAKIVGEYVGLPDSVNTVIGAPGDLVAKPLEAAFVGLSKTAGDTFDQLCDGEIVDAAASLVGGTVDTAINIVAAPVEVVGDTIKAIFSWFD